jgi:hypothetical protein
MASASVAGGPASSGLPSSIESMTLLDLGLFSVEKQALTPGEARLKQALWAFYTAASPAARKRVRRRLARGKRARGVRSYTCPRMVHLTRCPAARPRAADIHADGQALCGQPARAAAQDGRQEPCVRAAGQKGSVTRGRPAALYLSLRFDTFWVAGAEPHRLPASVTPNLT